jgi:flagellar biogenesis protein FliO
MSHVILLALAPIFFVMVLGYVAGRFHRTDNRQRAGSSVVEVSGSHAVYVSKPQAVATLIERAASSVRSGTK